MMHKKLRIIQIFLLLFLIQYNLVVAQDDYTIGSLSHVTVTYTTPQKWTLTGKLEYRSLFVEGITGQAIEDSWRSERIIFAPMISKRITAKGVLGIGWQMQAKWDDIEPTEYFIRPQLQYSISNKYAKYRTTHRFLVDVGFEKNEPIVSRLRYRYNIELPLSGASVDVGEWYIKVGLENIFIYKNPTFSQEIRITPFIGYLLNKANKLEIGVDYRFTHPFEAKYAHQAWLNLGWFYSITAN